MPATLPANKKLAGCCELRKSARTCLEEFGKHAGRCPGPLGCGLNFYVKQDVMRGWEELPRILLSLAVAFVLGLPIGWERGDSSRPGLRTYPLLAMGACAYIEIGQFVFRNNMGAQASVFQGLVSGIGFIGAGAIIKGEMKVHGLATAVSLWVTVAIGIAASYDLFALAAILSGTTLLVLWLLKS